MPRKTFKEKGHDKKVSRLQIESKSTEELKQTHRFISNLLEYRKTKKLETTYIGGLQKSIDYNEENKIYCAYNFDGTITGRLSCGGYKAGKDQPKGVSFHTLPRIQEYNVRSTCVAPPGYVFVTVDYAAMELRVLAHLAREDKMIQAFKSGDDLHWFTTELIYEKPRDQLIKDQRQGAKETSFLTIYGGTAVALAGKLGCSIGHAQWIMDSWFKAYDKIQPYMDHVYKFIEENKYAYSIFGRRRNLLNVKSRNRSIKQAALRQGLNFTIQSTASDILLCALLGIDQEFKARNLNSRICQTVHDSGEFLVAYDELEEALGIIKYYMERNPIMTNRFGVSLSVPLETEFICGKSFGDGIEYEKGELPNPKEIMEYMNAN